MTHVWLWGYVLLAPFLGGLIGSTNRKSGGKQFGWRVLFLGRLKGLFANNDSLYTTRKYEIQRASRIIFFFRPSSSSGRKYGLANFKPKPKVFSLDCFQSLTRGKGTGAFCKKEATQFQKWYSQTSTFQAPLYKNFVMRTPCLTIGRLKPWWVENFVRKKIYLIIPAFRWATNSPAWLYTIFHLPPLVGMPFPRNRGPRIHCRCNFRCKTKSSNKQFLSPWSNIEYLLCIF